VYLKCEYITRALIILLTDLDGQTERLIASAHRAVVRAERKMRRALQVRSYSTRKGIIIDYLWDSQVRRKLIHDHRRIRTSAAKVEEVPAEQKGRSEPSPPLRVIIPRTESPKTSPVQSPSTRSTTSSMSSLASVQAESEGSKTETETDTGILRRLYLKKVEGRMEGAYSGLEKAEVWLKIVKTVLEDVERRGLDERM
jgi:hypothetical protein